jgi:hypothetical protein
VHAVLNYVNKFQGYVMNIGPGCLELAILKLAADGAPWTCEAVCQALPGVLPQAVRRSFWLLKGRGLVRLTHRPGKTRRPVLAIVRVPDKVPVRQIPPVQARTPTPPPVQARQAPPVQARACS